MIAVTIRIACSVSIHFFYLFDGFFGMVKEKIVHEGVLSLCEIDPFIISRKILDWVSPNPVHGFPSSDGVVYPCSNTSLSAGIQTHESLTKNVIVLLDSLCMPILIVHFLGVNFIALVIRLLITISNTFL